MGSEMCIRDRMFSGPNGTALPSDKICIALTRVDGVLVATLNALNRWSISGLQEQANVVIDTLVNAITLSKVGTWVYLREFCTEISSKVGIRPSRRLQQRNAFSRQGATLFHVNRVLTTLVRIRFEF